MVTLTVEGVLSEVYLYCGLRLTGITEELIRFFFLSLRVFLFILKALCFH